MTNPLPVHAKKLLLVNVLVGRLFASQFLRTSLPRQEEVMVIPLQPPPEGVLLLPPLIPPPLSQKSTLWE
jgi:hypothetical protein